MLLIGYFLGGVIGLFLLLVAFINLIVYGLKKLKQKDDGKKKTK